MGVTRVQGAGCSRMGVTRVQGAGCRQQGRVQQGGRTRPRWRRGTRARLLFCPGASIRRIRTSGSPSPLCPCLRPSVCLSISQRHPPRSSALQLLDPCGAVATIAGVAPRSWRAIHALSSMQRRRSSSHVPRPPPSLRPVCCCSRCAPALLCAPSWRARCCPLWPCTHKWRSARPASSRSKTSLTVGGGRCRSRPSAARCCHRRCLALLLLSFGPPPPPLLFAPGCCNRRQRFHLLIPSFLSKGL